MTSEETTVANNDLWCAYLRQQWAFWLDPFGIFGDAPDQILSAAAARLAQWLTLVGLAPLDWLYRTRAMSAITQPNPPSTAGEDGPIV